MKVSIRRWLGFAALPAALLFFGLSNPAHAVSYQCNDVQSEPNDSIEINQTGNCTISSSITAKNDITINVTGGTIDTQGLTSTEGKIVVKVQGNGTFNDEIKAENNVEIEISNNGILDAKAKITSVKGDVFLKSLDKDVMTKAIDSGQAVEVLAGIQDGTSAGKIIIDGDIRANTEEKPLIPQVGTGTNVLLRAQETIKTKSVSTNGTAGAGSSSCGGIQIDANLHPFNNTLFTIGDDTPNGVNGVLDTRTSIGGGTDPFYRACGIAVTNGVSASQAGLKVSDFASIQTTNSASRGNIVILDAQNGNLILPTAGGTFDISSSGQGGGTIYLLARKIVAADNTVIKASPGDNTAGFLQGIFISADTVEFTGATGLTLEADGKGADPSSGQSQIVVVPTGGISPTYSNQVKTMSWNLDFPNLFNLKQPVHFDGGTSGQLNIHADGDDTLVAISGYPVKLNGGKATIQAKGGKNGGKHEIIIGFSGAKTGTDEGLVIDNSDDVLFFARGEGNNAAGGDISIAVDVATLKALDHNVIFRANGPQSKDGDGGTIQFFSSFVLLDEDTKVKFDADASVNSSGNAQLDRDGRKAILFDAGSSEIKVGKAKGTFQFSANGGGASGNAGAIEIRTTDKVTVRNNVELISAFAPSFDGDGGSILIDSSNTVFNQNFFSTSEAVELAIRATGGVQNGKGGTITIPFASGKNFPAGISRLNVNALMKVDGGFLEPQSTPYGTIELNGVACSQQLTGIQSWPKTAWQCSGANHVDDVIQAANMVPTNLKNQLLNTPSPQNPIVQVYNMRHIDHFRLFFDDTPFPVGQSLTFGRTLADIRVSAAFDYVFTGGNEVDASIAAGSFESPSVSVATIRHHSILHEIGHEFDYMWGGLGEPGNPGNPTAFEQAIIDDASNDFGINFSSPGISRPCLFVQGGAGVFSQTTCNLVPNQDNFNVLRVRFLGSISPFITRELFGIAFGHVLSEAPANYGNIPELQRAIDLMPATKLYILGLINSPPMPIR